jgi:hypothetical protein
MGSGIESLEIAPRQKDADSENTSRRQVTERFTP